MDRNRSSETVKIFRRLDFNFDFDFATTALRDANARFHARDRESIRTNMYANDDSVGLNTAAAAYGAIERDDEGDVERATTHRSQHQFNRTKTVGLVALVGLVGVGAVTRATTTTRTREVMFPVAKFGDAAADLPDGAYYVRGGKHRRKDPWLRENNAVVPMSSMTPEQISANVHNWCRFHNSASNGDWRCGIPCRQNEENGNNAPEVYYLGTTVNGEYRTISRKGEDGNMYVCYSDWNNLHGWNRKLMKCPTSGARAVVYNNTNVPEGAKLTISAVDTAWRHTTNVEYVNKMGTLYTMVNKQLAANDPNPGDRGLCWDFGGGMACHAKVTESNIKNVNAQFEFIPVTPDASGDVSACPA